MDKAIAAIPASLSSSRKASARAALIDLKDPARATLSECFRQFGVETVILNGNAADRLRTEKFEACVVKLAPPAQPIMDSVRTSPSNSRMILYGLGGSVQDALGFSKYGINAIFREPLERAAAMKLVRATQMLVLHELRRYVRIPVITEVAVTTHDQQKLTATSIELSSGGMSLRSGHDTSVGQAVEISLALLTLPRVWVRGTVSWRNAAGKCFGVRFDSSDDRRLRIKEWIDAYLEN
jgi:PilZ domain